MARNRHPFEGDIKRAKRGRCRLWTGTRGEFVTRYRNPKRLPFKVWLPSEALVVVGRSDDLLFLKRYVALQLRRKNQGIALRKLYWCKQQGRWWMITDF